MWKMSLLVMKVGNRYLHMEEMLAGMAVFVVKGRCSELLWYSFTIAATFNNFIKMAIIKRRNI